MYATVLGTEYPAFCFPAGYTIRVVLSLLNRAPPAELYLAFPDPTEMDVRSSHPRNTYFPRTFTESGIVTEVRPRQR